MRYDPEIKEQVVVLKDGRTIHKTHNGFRCFVISKKGETTKVTEEYYAKAKRVG